MLMLLTITSRELLRISGPMRDSASGTIARNPLGAVFIPCNPVHGSTHPASAGAGIWPHV